MVNNLFKSILYAFLATTLLALVFFVLRHSIIVESDKVLMLLSIVFAVNIVSVLGYRLIISRYFPDSGLQKEHEIKALKTIEKYRREFFGNVSHELKTPIFNIQGYVETLIEGALYDKSVNKKYLKRTSKSVDRLIYIIQDLESISQLESEEIKLEITEWNLRDLISEIIEQFEIKAKKKKIKLLHDRKSTNFDVLADKGKMGQVLSNLISNSIKYGKKNGTTKISCHQDKGKNWIVIRDDGIGVSEKNVSRLFERFYRVDKSRSRDQGGTGLGLSIVKHILEAHNQTINVKSEIEKGTKFTFSIHSNKYAKK